MRDRISGSHPERVEAIEVEWERIIPGCPALVALGSDGTLGRVVALVPESDRHLIYVGRLVRIADRYGCIEAIGGRFALVRYVYWFGQ